MDSFSIFQSPFSWRYGSPAMRSIWSEEYKRRLWRRIWIALARVESRYGIASPSQVEELESHADEIDMIKAHAIEEEIRHDLMAELRTFASQCPTAGGVLHMGATSMDIEDNADAIRIRESLRLIRTSLQKLLEALADKAERFAELPAMAFTHLQPAEPTTLGYRYACYAQDLYDSCLRLDALMPYIRGKGFKGAVGTSAAYGELIGVEHLDAFEEELSTELGIAFFAASSQTYPRVQDYRVLSILAEIAAVVHKMAFDFRVLQMPPIGELAEPFGSRQIGSSAMPFKRNPIEAEKIDSLARLLSSWPAVAWGNAALSGLERTLDDSANRRVVLPEAFLACDEILRAMLKIVEKQTIDEDALARNVATYAPFAATERVLMAMSRRGGDRQETHERLRDLAMQAWDAVRSGRPNPLMDLIRADSFFASILGKDEIESLFDVRGYFGAAADRARRMARLIRENSAAGG